MKASWPWFSDTDVIKHVFKPPGGNPSKFHTAEMKYNTFHMQFSHSATRGQHQQTFEPLHNVWSGSPSSGRKRLPMHACLLVLTVYYNMKSESSCVSAVRVTLVTPTNPTNRMIYYFPNSLLIAFTYPISNPSKGKPYLSQ